MVFDIRIHQAFLALSGDRIFQRSKHDYVPTQQRISTIGEIVLSQTHVIRED